MRTWIFTEVIAVNLEAGRRKEGAGSRGGLKDEIDVETLISPSACIEGFSINEFLIADSISDSPPRKKYH